MVSPDATPWVDEDQLDLRPYAVTGGRTRPRHTMRLLSLLVATRPVGIPLAPEAHQIADLCGAQPTTVAELAAQLRQPVQVVKIVLSDLIDDGVLTLATPVTADPKDPQLLEATLAALRRRHPDAAAS
jgi:hypothetical protein